MTTLIKELISPDILKVDLHKNSGWYRAIYDNVNEAIIVLDENMRIISANKKALQLLDFTDEEMIGLNFEDIHCDLGKNHLHEMLSKINKNLNFIYEASFSTKDERIIQVESNCSPARFNNQLAVICIIRDIAEKKRIESELRNSYIALEERVHERTAKLTKLNRELRRELLERNDIRGEIELTNFLLPQLPDAVIVTTPEGEVVRWMGRAEKIFGYSSREIVGKSISILYDPTVSDHMHTEINNKIIVSKEFVGEISCIRKDGSRIFVEASKRPIVDKDGKHIFNICIKRDITERKKLEQVLHDSESRYSDLVDSQRDFIIRADLEGRLTFVNDVFCKKFMKKKTDLINKEPIPFFENYSPSINNDNNTLFQSDNAPDNLPIPLIVEQYANTADGWRWIAWINSPIRDEYGNIIEFQCVGHDITMLKKTEEKMLTYQKRLQSLAAEMSLVEERQRRRIAQVLHDSIGQSLALCKFLLKSLESSQGPEEYDHKVEQIDEAITGIIKETRSLTFELSPPILYELGLGQAVKRLSEQIFKDHNLHVRFYEYGTPEQLSGDILGLLFQVTREIFVNIVKHAQARNVQVNLHYVESQVQIEVKDDGKGFDIKNIYSNPDKSNCFGLFSIFERIQYMGGYVNIKTQPGNGTFITLRMPYNNKGQN
jgi:PAS domain S-box-containing protein